MYYEQSAQKARTQRNKVSHVENGDKEPVEKHDSDTDVGCDPPRDGKGRSDVGDLTPIEGEETHGHAMGHAKQLVDSRIIGCYPAHPREVRECGEKIGGQEIYVNDKQIRIMMQ